MLNFKHSMFFYIKKETDYINTELSVQESFDNKQLKINEKLPLVIIKMTTDISNKENN